MYDNWNKLDFAMHAMAEGETRERRERERERDREEGDIFMAYLYRVISDRCHNTGVASFLPCGGNVGARASAQGVKGQFIAAIEGVNCKSS